MNVSSLHELSSSWLAELQPLFCGVIDLIIEPQRPQSDAEAFEYGAEAGPIRAVLLPDRLSPGTDWIHNLTTELRTCSWTICLANLIFESNPRLQSVTDGNLFRNESAILAEILTHSERDKLLIALVPANFLSSEQASTMRAWLPVAHRLEGIVHLTASGVGWENIHPQFGFALLLIRSGPAENAAGQVARIVDLRSTIRQDWHRIVSSVAKRGGGEVGPTIVLRNARFDQQPWTYERFSKGYEALRADAKQLGALSPLKEFVEPIRMGFDPTVSAKYIDLLGDSDDLPDGTIACFGGRSIGQGGALLSPVYAIKREHVPEDLLLRRGDVLLRSFINLRSKDNFVLATTVPEHILPATYGSNCIRLRWRPDVRPDVAELLTRYLNSNHVRDWLVANGAQINLNIATLMRLEVPVPSKELLDALAVLAGAEHQYRAWADEVADTRGGLFTARSIAEQMSIVFGRQRIEIERLRVARDAESLDYQIRNYYPHPIALRWELISQADPGTLKLRAVLDCAEHLLMLLTVLAIIQEQSSVGHPQPVQEMLASFGRNNVFHFDWGKCTELVKAGVKHTRRDPNPLSRRFPELASLAESFDDEYSPWSVAERHLRTWRNKQAHLQRPADASLNEMCDEFVEHLRCLLETARFLTALPMVHVADYNLNPVTAERMAGFDFVQGLSTVFKRLSCSVQSELPRGAVGFLDRSGQFISASPWLTMDSCPVCKRPELFMFSRYERGVVTNIAMETGHPQESTALARSIATAIGIG